MFVNLSLAKCSYPHNPENALVTLLKMPENVTHYSGAPAVRRASRAEPHTYRSWQLLHVLAEPDGEPCISFFMVILASSMVRIRTDDHNTHHC